jgi:hypothetical protein
MGLPSFILPIMGKGYLPLTKAWQTATSETDTTILNALNTFEGTLIANSLSSLITAYYPMVGGTSTKHAFNFMNTSLYNLTFNGFWTHSANGALPNGTNAYADTGINASTVLTQNNNHLGFYSRTNSAVGSKTSMGAYVSGSNTLSLGLKFSAPPDSAVYLNANGVLTQGGLASPVLSSDGMYIGSKTSSAIGGVVLYKNGSSIGSNTIAVTTNTYPNANVLISSLRTNLNFDDKQCAGAIIGLALTAGQALTLSTAINTLNTALSRNVY